MFLDHLPFYLSSPLCYLIGPGDRLLNLFFLALHSIVPYLLGGRGLEAGLPCPLILTDILTDGPLPSPSLPASIGSGQSLCGNANSEVQHPPRGAPRPTSPNSQPVFLTFPCRSHLLGHSLSSPGLSLPPFSSHPPPCPRHTRQW